ncbi:small heat shock protein, chloroplastic-like isoform X1 [Solanum pennellii]|uniref:Small heat shock protein, chloroplastic-like isoform X1 n=1 Tax=Solanum pennellii TaxID=28526 RepID=A0ABM1HEY7_SOLPN|nr:small heat shock protein, chloroplastic-like isoform X1 [Solanum pennellii]
MAFRTALRRISSFYNLLNNAPSSRVLTGSLAPLTSRFLSYAGSVSVTDSNEESFIINACGGSFARFEQFPIHRGACDAYMINPFQISGPGGAYEAKNIEEGMHVRMEMPGIDKEDVKVLISYGTIIIKGEGKKESTYEDSGRTYSANIEICSNSYEAQSMEANMKNGVLRMLIPKSKTPQKDSTRVQQHFGVSEQF